MHYFNLVLDINFKAALLITFLNLSHYVSEFRDERLKVSQLLYLLSLTFWLVLFL